MSPRVLHREGDPEIRGARRTFEVVPRGDRWEVRVNGVTIGSHAHYECALDQAEKRAASEGGKVDA